MAYDGLINYSIVSEWKQTLLNGKVDKIYEPNYDEILLGIYSNGTKYAIDLITNSQYYRANLTTNAKPNPNQAPNFCMALRKYLLGTRISNIETNNLERIIFISFEGYNKTKDFSCKKLIVELMGKYSNIILVDSKNIIIDSLKHFSKSSGSSRNIYSGEEYKLPPSDKLDFMEIIDEKQFFEILRNQSNLLQKNSLSFVISNTFTGISKQSIIMFENDLSISDEVSESNSNILYEYLSKLLLKNNQVICVNVENNYGLRYIDSSKENSLQVNFFLDDYYTKKENDTNFKVYRDNLSKLILNRLHLLQKKLNSVLLKIAECKEAEIYQKYGELITSNLYRIPNYNTSSVTVEDYYNNNMPITISLDASISPSANAKKFFKKYKKLKNANEFVNIQKLDLTNEINYLESIIYEISMAKTVSDIDEIYNEIQESELKIGKQQNATKHAKIRLDKKKSGYGEPLKFIIDGFTVLIGKNNKQNDYLTTKIANKDDIWLHVKDFHGSHVILRTDNKTPSQETINKCAKLAKEHSKAVNSSNVPVDYTLVKYVKKPSGSKPGMVIYTHEQSVNV